MITGWKQDKLQLLHTRLRQAREHTFYTIWVVAAEYGKFATRYKKAFLGSKKQSTPSSEMQRIYEFSQRMRTVYSASFWTLYFLLRGLEAASGSKEKAPQRPPHPTYRRWRAA
jgi:hypothetical protein